MGKVPSIVHPCVGARWGCCQAPIARCRMVVNTRKPPPVRRAIPLVCRWILTSSWAKICSISSTSRWVVRHHLHSTKVMSAPIVATIQTEVRPLWSMYLHPIPVITHGLVVMYQQLQTRRPICCRHTPPCHIPSRICSRSMPTPVSMAPTSLVAAVMRSCCPSGQFQEMPI